MPLHEWHDQIMEEKAQTILGSLREERVFALDRTEQGFKFVELCDEYYGTTLSVDQMHRLIEELRQLLGEAVS